MVDKWFLKLLLSPLSLLFGIGVAIKSGLYAVGLLKGVKFDIPVINVGNLTVGGAGKTPHVEYLINLLGPYIPIATLSRGYKRKTSGFLIARPNFTSDHVGDEPLLYSRKFPHVTVAVSESRVAGIPKLLQQRPGVRAVILDDAYQHRAIVPNFNILLTEHNDPFFKDWLLPAGRLREWRSAYKRADVIIVTKCPEELSEDEKLDVLKRIKPLPSQRVFFTRYAYFTPYRMWDVNTRTEIAEDHEVLLICGIARTNYLLDYLHSRAGAVKMIQYEDHHVYDRHDLEMIKKHYDNMVGPRRMILTTEKDAMRLQEFRKFLSENEMPVDILPIKVEFLFGEGMIFDDWVKQFLLNFKV